MKHNLNVSGAYLISNKVNGKVYVGSSKNIRLRWKTHRNKLRHNKHCNQHLQSAFNKYGTHVFTWSVLEVVDLDSLVECEQKWINHFDAANREKGYNKSSVAYSMQGYKHSDETKAKLSAAHLGEKHPEWRRDLKRKTQSKKVYQFDLQGRLIKEYSSVLKAQEDTGIYKQTISGCCRGINRQVNGFMWSYSKNPPTLADDKKMVKIQDLSGHIFNSIQDAAEKLGKSRNQIYNLIKNGRLTKT